MDIQYLLCCPPIFLLLFWFTGWFKIILALMMAVAAVLFYLVRMTTLKHEKSDLQRRLVERNELLQHSTQSEKKAMEKALLADRNKGSLLSRINHELRTPMNGVLGMTTLLNETNLTSEQQEYVTAIAYSGDKLMKVINEIMMNDVLEYSKVESGKELEAKDFDVSTCIEETMDVFAAKAAAANIDLLYCIDDNVPLQIAGDARRIRQILMNLVENAIRVTAKGEIYIGVKLIACKEDNRINLQFEVRDTGSGIKAAQTRLIEEDLRVQQTSSNYNAIGVGLIICKKLITLMGGDIQLSSTEGKGTTVTFSIYSKAGMQPLRQHIHTEVNELEGKKILITSANATLREILCRQLDNFKLITTATSSGEEALEMLTQVSFDLVITDLLLQGRNGIELAENIKRSYPAMPVLLLNMHGDERYKANAALFSGVLNKPVKQRLLLDAILNQIRNKDGEAANKPQTVHKLSENFSKRYPLKILIAEDNPVNQKWTIKILTKLGYQPELANNGKQVLDIVSNRQYDLILMDVQMPEMDGLEATRMIRLCLDAQPVIIAMTANVMQGDRQDCIQSGMDDYISKPVELNELVGMLEKWALLIREKKQAFPAGKK